MDVDVNKKNILVILGPNLNMVGIREKSIYGQEKAENINYKIKNYSNKSGLNCDIFQSNWEGAIIDKIHESISFYNAVIINPGALAHYSYSLRDAIACVEIPFIEVHMSNIFSREDFRHNSVISSVCIGHISGFGVESYFLAIDALKKLI